MTVPRLRALIGEKNQALEAFPRQNRNCLDYFERYTKKFDELRGKYANQGRIEAQIKELLESLRGKKAMSIEDNFKTMAKHFSETFARVVPGGSASLRLVKMQVDDSQKSFPTQFPTQKVTLGDNEYAGIRVRVSFNQQISGREEEEQIIVADGGEQEEGSNDLGLAQLSGGQKAVVAACLIFAIQKIDAAPFYIMDEFDAALDPQYCQGIAEEMRRLSRPHSDADGKQYVGSQFLLSTHKIAIAEAADKVFEVKFRGQKSQLKASTAAAVRSILEKA
jgi:chromosome segregation ATPase